ncbi:MAG: carboxypeptidase regulatory-like domain-containing protein [Planctomycetaceae bacterium]
MRTLLNFVFLLCVVGCGSDQVATYPVTGRVVFLDGSPVRTGTVELESKQFGTTATGSINQDGTFVLGTYTPNDGAAEGEHNAIVVQMIINDGSIRHTVDHGNPVPPSYGDYDTSPLTVSVQPIEQNEIVLTLESAP